MSGWRASVGHKCFQDCAAPVRCGGKGVAGKASGAKRLEWHRMAKPSPQQPSDAWATKTTGLPPVESPFPNYKGAQGAPERVYLGTMTWVRTVTLVHYQVERKGLGSLTPSCRSHPRGLVLVVSVATSHLPPPIPMPTLNNIWWSAISGICATARSGVDRQRDPQPCSKWLQMQEAAQDYCMIISIQYSMQGTYIHTHTYTGTQALAGLMSLTLRGTRTAVPVYCYY